MFGRQTDKRSEPVRLIVALGESTTWGYSVSEKEKCWVNRTVRMLEDFQGAPVKLINQGIGSNVLTSLCPAYPSSRGAAALDRVEDDVIAFQPDLVFLSYGLNDSRGGTPPEVFRDAYQMLVDRIRAGISPVIVVLNTYYMHEVCYGHKPWDHSDYDVTELYNVVIRQLAEKNDLVLADVYAAEIGVDWFIDEDHCHPNDLGHFVVANRVFEAIARNCSFVARQMPKESLIRRFFDSYGNGPDGAAGAHPTKDVLVERNG